VAQDYFSKWPFAITLPDQKAVLFGQNSPLLQLPLTPISEVPDPGDYSCQFQRILVEMWEMVQVNATKSAERAEQNDIHCGAKNNPTKGKLDLYWTGPGNVISIKVSPTL